MLIEWGMYFALGFLAAALLAVLAAASLWRRAVRLTTRRLAASVPADAEAVRVEKDFQAAHHAREVRRIQMALAELRRVTAEERIAVGRERAEADRLRSERDVETTRAEASLAREAELGREAVEREARIAALGQDLEAARARIDDLDGVIGERDTTVEALEGELEDRAVEIATRRTEIDALELQLDAMKADVAARQARIDELTTALGRAETSATQERDRADRLDRRIERLVADVADREENADRRQRELDRARDALTTAQARINQLSARSEHAEPAPFVVGDGDARQRIHDLEIRVEALTKERDRLTTALQARAAAEPPPAPGTREAARAHLRESIAGLAAEMVRLTDAVEGRGGTIDRVMLGAGPESGPRPSLADRIRNLRAAGGTRPGAGRPG